MALAVTSPLVLPGAPRFVRPRQLTGLLGPVLSLAVCALGAAAVALPAMRATTPTSSAGPVTVAVLGDISTAGLPATAAVSLLTVRNTGTSPLEWSARPAATGAGAAGVVVEAWVPSGTGCTQPSRLLDAQHWSENALAPGATTPVCVRVRSAGTASGTATPQLTVAARGA